MIKRIKALIKKELIAVFRDKKSRYILIIPPIIQLVIFSLAATLDVKNIALGICNEDMGKISIELTERFAGSKTFSQIKFYDNLAKAEDDLVMQKISSILHFDSSFSKKLLSNNDASVQVILDGRKSNSTQIILGYINKIIGNYNLEILKSNDNQTVPSILIPRNWFNPNLIYQWFTVPGLVAILAMTTSLSVTALSISREKEIGTFEQLLVS
ncbi:MAG: ABC transporter permease, partial [Chlamydiae bacterium]|nr:ABC transporter permease [Chlamydiota bacterium]